MPAFPIVGPSSIEDWVSIGDGWHHIVYAFEDGSAFPVCYIDGEPVEVRAEYALYDRALSPDEVRAHYKAATE